MFIGPPVRRQALTTVALKRERDECGKRLRALADASDVLIVALDADGRVTLMNRRLAALVGMSSRAATDKLFAKTFVCEADEETFCKGVAAAISGAPASEVHSGVRDAIGAIRRVRWHVSGVQGSNNRTKFVHLIGVDITERRSLERRVADAEALNALAPLALGLAHEIRNPLNAAMLELHLLGRGIDRLGERDIRDPLRRRVTIVESEIKRLERLVTDFLELARPRAPQREPVDLGRVVADVIELESEAIAGRGIHVNHEITVDAFALGDVEKLKQVALNLVVNAIEAMPDGGTLRASVEIRGGDVAFAIGDTGPGIDPGTLAEIFDPFFTTKSAGTGLGLSIVRKIVDQHEGRVQVHTKLSEGTTVRVVLPRCKAQENG